MTNLHFCTALKLPLFIETILHCLGLFYFKMSKNKINNHTTILLTKSTFEIDKSLKDCFISSSEL